MVDYEISTYKIEEFKRDHQKTVVLNMVFSGDDEGIEVELELCKYDFKHIRKESGMVKDFYKITEINKTFRDSYNRNNKHELQRSYDKRKKRTCDNYLIFDVVGNAVQWDTQWSEISDGIARNYRLRY